MNHLVCFGLGYSANFIIKKLDNFQITATKRNIVEKKNNLNIIRFDEFKELPQNSTHILISISPIDQIDIVYEKFNKQIINLSNLKWIGYLSTTGVYGDHKGNWVNENSKTIPNNKRNIIRLGIEKKWLNLNQIPINIFRLAGIYGPGRNPIERILNNEEIPIINAPGNFFSRIHVEDLTNIIVKSMNNPKIGEIYNIADDLPEEYSKVVEYSYDLLDKKPKIYTDLKEANISQMMKEFYQNNKKISNEKIKEELDVKLLYPTYKSGLKNIMQSMLKNKE